jgi:hypothetical protein
MPSRLGGSWSSLAGRGSDLRSHPEATFWEFRDNQAGYVWRTTWIRISLLGDNGPLKNCIITCPNELAN